MLFSPLLRDARRLAPEELRFAARAWLGAPVVRVSLALLGLRPTLRWVEASGGVRRLPRPRPVGVEKGRFLVRGAFRLQGAGGRCLPESMVQYLLHRRDGLPVRLVVGVKRPGPGSEIAAHAWVEADAPGARPDDPSFVPLYSVSLGEHEA